MLDESTAVEGGSLNLPTRASSRPFTDRYLLSLKAGPRRYEVLDARRKGLLFRVTENGSKAFYFRYKRAGHAVRIMIGHYPTVSLQKAYETHAELTRRLNKGEDVRGAPNLGVRSRGAAHPPAEPAMTVGDLAKEFIERYLYRERKNPREAEMVIEANILRYWRTRPAKSITRRDGVLLLDKVVDRDAPVMANRVGALLAQMFRFGVTRGMLDASPFIALGKPGGSEKGRKRKLDETEVRIFWKKLTRSRLNAEVRIALKLILVTAQRPGEVALAAWDEFDLEKKFLDDSTGAIQERSAARGAAVGPGVDLDQSFAKALWGDEVLDPLTVLAGSGRCAHHGESAFSGHPRPEGTICTPLFHPP